MKGKADVITELGSWINSTCPLGELVRALEEHTLPPLEWGVRMRAIDADEDPAVVAWRQCRCLRGMVYFIAKVCGPVMARAAGDILNKRGLVAGWLRAGGGYPLPLPLLGEGDNPLDDAWTATAAQDDACAALRAEFRGFDLETVRASYHVEVETW